MAPVQMHVHILFFILCFYAFLIALWLLFAHVYDYSGVSISQHHPFVASKTKTHTASQTASEAAGSSDNNPDSDALHTMYSVGCDHMVMWQLQQSVTLDYSWWNVQQRGHLTRIVSGCNYASNNIRQMSLTSIPLRPDIHFLDHDKDLTQQCLQFVTSNDQTTDSNANQIIFRLNLNKNARFHIIFVPSFDDIKKENAFFFGEELASVSYAQLNRMLALYMIYRCTDYKHFLPQSYMMMIDPDFIFMNAISVAHLKNEFQLAPGKPVAGLYGLGAKWVKWLRGKGETVHVSPSDSHQFYEAGVPYIMHNDDWYELIVEWIQWMQFAFSNYKGIESDMYAYMIASYKLGLKHTLSNAFMVTCMHVLDQKHSPFSSTQFFIHYCSAYKVEISEFAELSQKVGDPIFTFNKHWTKARRNRDTKEQQLWMIECESPVLVEAPEMRKYELPFDDTNKDAKYSKEYKQYQVLRLVVPAFNNALIAFKEKHCKNSTLINRSKQIITHEATMHNGDVLYHTVEDLL